LLRFKTANASLKYDPSRLNNLPSSQPRYGLSLCSSS
jgi:hypothetical protein